MFTRLNAHLSTETTYKEDRYFVAQVLVDDNPDTSYLDQKEFSARRKAYKRGDFYYCGVVVREFDDDDQEVGRASLWGIESDSGSYFAEVANELVTELL
jgi:hypothetical protein